MWTFCQCPFWLRTFVVFSHVWAGYLPKISSNPHEAIVFFLPRLYSIKHLMLKYCFAFQFQLFLSSKFLKFEQNLSDFYTVNSFPGIFRSRWAQYSQAHLGEIMLFASCGQT